MKKILFVCTGNTCRSPMAMALFNDKAKKLGLCATAFSRGLYADGSEISKNACEALRNVGIADCDHISRTVSREDISEADTVFGISRRHAENLRALFPEFGNKIFAFPFDISDPFGGDLDIYKASLAEISKGIDAIIEMLFHKESSIVIERLNSSHIDGMEIIENTCFSEPWSRKSLEELLDCDYAVYFVARDTESGAVAGYAGMYVSLDTGNINNIGVLPIFRRKGIGERLLCDLLNYSRENGIVLVTLEVRESNTPAIALYEKLGFLKVGVRKNYYRSPSENAVLYNKALDS